jgi:uncharacterized protein (DUF2252 family)
VVRPTIVKAEAHPSIAERKARGEEARLQATPSSHAGWHPASDRPNPVALLEAQNSTREPDLVPVRHGRMMVSPFTFYRGAAKIMADNLQRTPIAGLHVQLCGDAHLSNFGAYASPERRLVFDLNDFDETLPGPFEYDVKRMAASFTIAARNNGFAKSDISATTLAAVTAYRQAMADFAAMRTMDIWYAHLDEDQIMSAVRTGRAKLRKGGGSKKDAKAAKREENKLDKSRKKAHIRDSLQALSKLGELVDGHYQIRNQPPIVVPARDLVATFGLAPDDMERVARDQFRAYRSSLREDCRRLLDRFEVIDVARKVVGVGSVGTRAFIVLLQGRDENDPLFLQIKEATASVLEGHLPKSQYRESGARVVHGQRLMQAASDIYLGWTEDLDTSRHFYWRQLRDMKSSADVEAMTPIALRFYGNLCGWTLARAHARSGDPVALATCLGNSDEFDVAINDFSRRYADQNEQDYDEFVKAIQSGRLEATEGV